MKKIASFYQIVLSFLLLIPALYSFSTDTRLYVAIDKETYSAAETVQFQVFLLNTAHADNTFFVEILDCKGNQLAKKMFPANAGIGWGNIRLPETADAEFYLLYCYTINKDTVEADFTKKVWINRMNDGTVPESEKKPGISSFIESGNLIAEVPNNILLHIIGQNGKGVKASGKIVNKKYGDPVLFETDEDGFVKISFNPEFMLQYQITATDKNGNPYIQPLPLASQYGVNLAVTVNGPSLTYTAFSFTPDESKLDYKLEISSKDVVVYRAEINFQVSLSVIAEDLQLKDFPEGFLTFRLLDKKDRFYAKRIIYNGAIETKGGVLKVVDTINNRVAITEIPAYINGNGYLNVMLSEKAESGTAKFVNKTLRDYEGIPVLKNDSLINDKLISVEKLPEIADALKTSGNQFLTLKGTVTNSEDKPVKNRKINLIFLYKNLKKDYLVAYSDKEGKFDIKGLVFYDSVTVYYQLGDKSEEKNSIKIKFLVTPGIETSGNEIQAINYVCMDEKETSSSFTSVKTLISLATNKGEITLKEVTVAAKKEVPKTDSEKYRENNVSEQHNQSNFLNNEFDFIANPQVIDHTPILDFLRGRFSLMINNSSIANVQITNLAGEGIGVYLNDMEVTSDLDLILYLTVKDLALVRFYNTPLKPRLESTKSKYKLGGGGDLMIYTKRGFTSGEKEVKGMAKTSIVGYDKELMVNPVVLKQDGYPQSICWKPNWTPKTEEIIYIGIPENQESKNVQVIIEGVNKTGTPYSFSKNLIFR